MAGLFSFLNLGANSLHATNRGIGVVGHNVANAGTEGYSRQRVDYSAVPGVPWAQGVEAHGPSRITDEILTRREWSTARDLGRSTDLTQALSGLESQIIGKDYDLVQAIANLFGGIMELASAPVDPALRGQVVDNANAVAAEFNRVAGVISDARSDADGRLGSLAKSASALAIRIAGLNNEIGQTPNDPNLQDQRDLAAKQLTELVGGNARVDTDGQMRFVLDNGAVMVDGSRAAELRTVPDLALDGHSRIELVDGNHVSDVTSSLSSGKIGGQLAFRDSFARDAASRLDEFAFQFATNFNAIHRQHAALDGTSGRDFFAEPSSAEGAALSLEVDPTISRDPSLIGSSAPGTGPGDATGLTQLMSLKDAKLVDNGQRSILEESVEFLSDLGSSVQRSKTEESLGRDRLSVLSSLRDSVSGVSTEEEMAQLSALQHAQEASIKFISVVDGLLGDLISQI